MKPDLLSALVASTADSMADRPYVESCRLCGCTVRGYWPIDPKILIRHLLDQHRHEMPLLAQLQCQLVLA